MSMRLKASAALLVSLGIAAMPASAQSAADVSLTRFDCGKAALTDSIEDTLNYKRVAKRVLAFVEASEFQLVETLAEHLAMLILEEFGVAWVRIVLAKPGAVRSSKDVGVEVERDRTALESWLEARARPAPVSPGR